MLEAVTRASGTDHNPPPQTVPVAGWGRSQPSSLCWQKPWHSRLFQQRHAWSRHCPWHCRRVRAPPAVARACGQQVLPVLCGAGGLQRDEGLPLPPKSP